MAKTLNLSEEELTGLFQAQSVLIERAYKLFMVSEVADTDEWEESKAAWMAQVDSLTAALHESAEDQGKEPTHATN